MVKNLQDKVALVTGGSRGLGAATARLLAAAGAEVAITYVSSSEKAESVASAVGGRAFQVDHGDPASAPGVIADVVSHFGGLDILVNNAAVSGGDPDRMHAVNYLGVIALIRAAAPVMRDNGRIINVGSGIGSRAGVPGVADYAATKAGIVGYTRGVARDLAGRGITANVVQAGLMDTDMTPPDAATLALLVSSLAIQRVADPTEVAETIKFLATREAGYVTGAVLDANGGYTA
jgi:NAD(P)-dependent dehydrogenase (short-subunit alcohol dehydrogenase family)